MSESSEALSELKEQQKRLSRQIGQAKKSGVSVDELMVQMKALSAQIKQIESKNKKQKQRHSAQASSAHSCSKSQSRESMSSAIFDYQAILPAAKMQHHTSEIQLKAVCLDQQVTDLECYIEAYLLTHPGSTPYHRPCVIRSIQRSCGHAVRYWVAYCESKIVGVLPLVQLNSRLFGNYCVSMPFFNYGGVLADSVDAAHALLKEAREWAKDSGAEHICYRYSAPSALGLESRSDKVTFYLALPPSSEDLWASFKSKLRSQIRKSQSYPHQVKQGGAELLDDFYQVFSVNMRDLGTPVYGKGFFSDLACALAECLCITVVYSQGTPSAAAIVIGHKKRLEIPWASTIRDFNHQSVNMLLYWHVLKWGIEQGYDSFDFGRCSRDAGTYKFKAQWGAIERPLYWDYDLISGPMPSLNTKNTKFSLLIRIWQRLPLWLANLLGPHLVKNLP